jgi:hypothetical protein
LEEEEWVAALDSESSNTIDQDQVVERRTVSDDDFHALRKESADSASR